MRFFEYKTASRYNFRLSDGPAMVERANVIFFNVVFFPRKPQIAQAMAPRWLKHKAAVGSASRNGQGQYER